MVNGVAKVCHLFFIDESRSKQMKNKEILNTNIQRGKELIESVTNPEVKKRNERSSVTTSIFTRKSSKTRKRIKKKVSSDSSKKRGLAFPILFFLFICVLTHYLFAVKFVL